MTFQPVIPTTGIAGFLFLERTRDAQQVVFDKSPVLARETQYFQENIHKATKAEDLVKDRMLLKVALGAFGLDEEIDKKYFLQRILEDGTEERDALANKLVDPRYRNFSAAFGYGDLLGPKVGQSDFASRIIADYKTRQFEVAVGNTDDSMRLALNFKREIASFANATKAENTKWFELMGNTPMRTVFETAFALPTAIGSLDVDRQYEIFAEKLDSQFGSRDLSVFTEPEKVDEMVRRYLAQSQLAAGPNASTPGMAAVTLLSNASLGNQGLGNLLLSRG